MRKLLLIAALIAPASSQTVHLTITPGASSSTLSADFGLALPGTLQGNYEATTNPLGTKTLPGLVGGIPTDNVPIATDVAWARARCSRAFPTGNSTWRSLGRR